MSVNGWMDKEDRLNVSSKLSQMAGFPAFSDSYGMGSSMHAGSSGERQRLESYTEGPI